MKYHAFRAACLLASAPFCVSVSASSLKLEVTNLHELFQLSRAPDQSPIITDMNQRGEFLHATSYISPLGGSAQATEAFVEHPDGTRTRFAIPYANGIFSELRLNNQGEIAAVLIPDKDHFDPLAIEVWVYSASGVPRQLSGLVGGAENLGFNDLGQVSVSNFDENQAYRYSPGVGWENLGSLSDDGYAVTTWGNGLNNSGAVVGGTSVGSSNTVTPG
jgi:hypothetical protein